MKRWMKPLAMAVAIGGWGTGSAWAQAPVSKLTPTQLSRCANEVQRLRDESARLTQWNARLDARRDILNARARDLDAEEGTIAKDDLQRGLDYVTRRKQHQADALAFNAEIDQIRRDIATLNVVKDDYDRNCADRSYDRADLDRMPEGPRNAMRAGLEGVAVPYLDPATPAAK